MFVVVASSEYRVFCNDVGTNRWPRRNEVKMPKSKANNVVQIGQRNLIDAEAMGALLGFTAQYVNRIAAAGKIPWHGVRNGAKVHRRFDALEVLGALKHGLDPSHSTK